MKKLTIWSRIGGALFRKDIWLPALSIIAGALMWSIAINDSVDLAGFLKKLQQAPCIDIDSTVL